MNAGNAGRKKRMRHLLWIAVAAVIGCGSPTEEPRQGTTEVDHVPQPHSYTMTEDGRLHCDLGDEVAPAIGDDAGADVEKRNWTIVDGYGMTDTNPPGPREVVPVDMVINWSVDGSAWPTTPAPGYVGIMGGASNQLRDDPDLAFQRGDWGQAADTAHGGIRWTFFRDGPGLPIDFVVKQDTAGPSATCANGGGPCIMASAGCNAGASIGVAGGRTYAKCAIPNFTVAPKNIHAFAHRINPANELFFESAILVAVFKHEVGHFMGLPHRGSSQKPFEPAPDGPCTGPIGTRTSGCWPANPVACDLMNGDTPLTCPNGNGICFGPGYTNCPSGSAVFNYCQRMRLRFFRPGDVNTINLIDQGNSPNIPICSAGNN
jgi:hypothetical protein